MGLDAVVPLFLRFLEWVSLMMKSRMGLPGMLKSGDRESLTRSAKL
ncbi:hypothetical protein [Corallococcus sp. EGB]|nr:hypothetical protein [Corallococcus sp. EGB]